MKLIEAQTGFKLALRAMELWDNGTDTAKNKSAAAGARLNAYATIIAAYIRNENENSNTHTRSFLH